MLGEIHQGACKSKLFPEMWPVVSTQTCHTREQEQHVQIAAGPPFSTVHVSVSHGQPGSENVKWKIPEVNNSEALTCMLF